MIRQTLKAVLFFGLVALVSAVTAYLVVKSQTNIRFVAAPKNDHDAFGYLEVDGNKWYQMITTTPVVDEHTPPGSHYHRIDLRSSQ